MLRARLELAHDRVLDTVPLPIGIPKREKMLEQSVRIRTRISRVELERPLWTMTAKSLEVLVRIELTPTVYKTDARAFELQNLGGFPGTRTLNSPLKRRIL